MSGVITVRVHKDVKEKVKKYGIKASNVMRAALLDEIRQREQKEFLRALEKSKTILSKLDMKTVTRSIREDREKR